MTSPAPELVLAVRQVVRETYFGLREPDAVITEQTDKLLALIASVDANARAYSAVKTQHDELAMLVADGHIKAESLEIMANEIDRLRDELEAAEQ